MISLKNSAQISAMMEAGRITGEALLVLGVVERHNAARSKQKTPVVRTHLSIQGLYYLFLDFIKPDDVFKHFQIMQNFRFAKIRLVKL